MPLESLLQLVETLRERITAHRAVLSQSETRTRYALIDPLLKELGWDTSDPAMVVPEYSSGTGRADYALLSNGRPAMMVEAKKLGENLHDRARSQGVQYCIEEGTQYFSVTDGARWEIYEPHKQVPIDQKRVVEFDLIGTSASEACLKALALWRPSVQSGGVAEGHSPVLTPSPEVESSPVPLTIPVAKPIPSVADHDKALKQPGWQRLSDVSWVKGHPNPVEIRFPDNSSVPISIWKSLMVESVRWLVSGNFLTRNRCPIQAPRAKQRYLVSTGPTHPTGQRMTYPVEVNPFYVEMHQSARDCVRNTRVIIEHVGQDPAQFKVRFS